LSIYVRPVREQIEHDRVIRHLQIKLKRKYDVAMNVGAEQAAASVKLGTQVLFPDLVLLTTGRKLAGIVEVETGESVHHLEAMAEWAPFGRLKVPFQLYVPVNSADIAKRLAADLGAHITELWSYHAIGDQIRLTLVQKSPIPGEARRKADRERAAEKRATAARPAPRAAKPAAAKPGAAKSAKAGKARPRAARPAPRKAPRLAARAQGKPKASKKPARRADAKRK
jgi:hypothetical protein